MSFFVSVLIYLSSLYAGSNGFPSSAGMGQALSTLPNSRIILPPAPPPPPSKPTPPPKR